MSLCQWFIDNKLSIHFGEDKTKFIVFSKARGLREINISFKGHSIKRNETAQYFGCQLYSKLRGEAITSKLLQNRNAKLELLYYQGRYRTPAYRRLLYNTLIQPHFDWCSSCFPLLKKNFKLKLQKGQDKCIRFCLNLLPRSQMDQWHFRKINWLQASNRVE